jgi:hypothetical protein
MDRVGNRGRKRRAIESMLNYKKWEDTSHLRIIDWYSIPASYLPIMLSLIYFCLILLTVFSSFIHIYLSPLILSFFSSFFSSFPHSTLFYFILTSPSLPTSILVCPTSLHLTSPHHPFLPFLPPLPLSFSLLPPFLPFLLPISFSHLLRWPYALYPPALFKRN